VPIKSNLWKICLIPLGSDIFYRFRTWFRFFCFIPCIIYNSGIYENAAIIGYISEQLSLGVAHGCTSVSESMKVTESKMIILQSINWELAFDVVIKC